MLLDGIDTNVIRAAVLTNTGDKSFCSFCADIGEMSKLSVAEGVKVAILQEEDVSEQETFPIPRQ